VSVASARVPILMYHLVAPAAPRRFDKYTIITREFAWQMAWLSRRGYSAVTIETLLALRQSPTGLPRRTVAITFDDGFAALIDEALPILERHGFLATFYLVAGFPDNRATWLSREGREALPLMTWEDARRLREAGHTIGSHGLTHAKLAEVGVERSRDELVQSRDVIGDRIGVRPTHLAYPHGSYDADTQRLAAESGYSSATTVDARRSSISDDPFALPRVPINGGEGRLDFIVRLATGAPVAGVMNRASIARHVTPWKTV
jgi:peptidoglycan/xylan/chitin deacetylase (PgdA/CDA1 family)